MSVCRSLKKTRGMPRANSTFVRLPAMDSNTTNRPSRLISGLTLSPFAEWPLLRVFQV